LAKRSNEFDEYALRGIRAEIERLQALEKQLVQAGRKGGQISIARGGSVIGSGMTAGGGEYPAAVQPQKRKRKLSAAGRKAISDAAKARWARQKAQTSAGRATTGGKKSGKKG